MRIVKCLRCGENKIHKSRGLCVKCFNKSWRDGSIGDYPNFNSKRGICKKCNMVKKINKGVCKKCYSKMRKKKRFYSLTRNVLRKELNNKVGDERKIIKNEIKMIEDKLLLDVINNPKKFLR